MFLCLFMFRDRVADFYGIFANIMDLQFDDKVVAANVIHLLEKPELAVIHK